MKQLIYLNYMLSLRKKTIKMLLKMAIFVAPQVSFCMRTTSGSSHARGWAVDLAARELPNPPPTDNLSKPLQVVRRPE